MSERKTQAIEWVDEYDQPIPEPAAFATNKRRLDNPYLRTGIAAGAVGLAALFGQQHAVAQQRCNADITTAYTQLIFESSAQVRSLLAGNETTWMGLDSAIRNGDTNTAGLRRGWIAVYVDPQSTSPQDERAAANQSTALTDGIVGRVDFSGACRDKADALLNDEGVGMAEYNGQLVEGGAEIAVVYPDIRSAGS